MEKGSCTIGQYAPRLIQHLDAALLEAGCSLEGIVVGSAAVALLTPVGAGEYSQSTGLMEESSERLPLVELLFPPFPEYLCVALRRVAEAQNVDPRWLRQGPPTVNTLFSSGLDVPLELPQGWRERIRPLVFRGDALHLHAPGRIDLIALEVAEAERGQGRSEVLAQLAPDEEELSWARAWLAELEG